MKPVETFHVRASSAPLGRKCAGSLRGKIRVDQSHPTATLGSATHVMLASLVRDGVLPWSKIDRVAKDYNCDARELRFLSARGQRLWDEVVVSFPEAAVEVELRHVADRLLLTGHADIISIVGRTGRVADWKTGRLDSDNVDQIRCYGTLLLMNRPELESVTVTILWVRDGEIENYSMTREDALDWLHDTRARVVNWDGIFRSGPHCLYCPRAHECRAANALARRDIAALVKGRFPRTGSPLARMTDDEIVTLYQRSKSVMALCFGAMDTLRSWIATHGDVVRADGMRLTSQAEDHRELNPIEAWGVLEQLGFDDADFAACLRMSVVKVEALVEAKGPAVQSAAARRELRKLLDAAGAVTMKQRTKLALRRQ